MYCQVRDLCSQEHNVICDINSVLLGVNIIPYTNNWKGTRITYAKRMLCIMLYCFPLGCTIQGI